VAKKPENQYTKPRRFLDDEEIKAAAPESRSWEEHQAACRVALAKAKSIQEQMEKLHKDWSEFEGLTLRAFKKMPKNDANFSESPLSPMRMMNAFKQNLAKLGWSWAAALPFGPEPVRTFLAVATDACTWGDRILQDEERQKKIDAAKKLADKAQEELAKIT